MEARDFIYHFTDILFSEIVKETILIENWEESDFDYRYTEFADIFKKMKESCLDSVRSDDEIFLMLRNSRKTAIKNFNEEMRKNFIEEFKRDGTNPAVFDQMLSADILKEDAVNAQSLELFRQFEAKTFTKKPKKRGITWDKRQ
ncbi:MAG: hypothetical protein LBI28_03655 [Treponema sp.]|jgi:hypothetical protein|nr:hypothetical protein [Treponema sp.]